MSKPLTKKEQAWIEKIKKLLENPPSDRLGLYTTGDAQINVYDYSKESEINSLMDRRNIDFCVAVNELGASLGDIGSYAAIHATAG